MKHYKTIDWSKYKLNRVTVRGHIQDIFTFDIETSNGYIFPGSDRVTAFDYTKPPSYYRDAVKVSLCYLWQFGINNEYYYGRNLYEFEEVLKQLDAIGEKVILWVHNLGFEQVALMNLFFPEKIFARKAHDVIYMEYSENVTFRCSFMLTNMSLAAWGHELGLEKIDGYDYDAIRTPITPLDSFEMKYGSRDLEIVRLGIEKKRAIYGRLEKIPITQTGQIRQKTLNLFKNDVGYHFKMARLLPKDWQEYFNQRCAFSGGNVHCNWYYANILLRAEDGDGVSCGDIASSYPFVCCSEKLPMTPWRRAVKPEYYLNNDAFCCLIEVRFENVEAKTYIDYISYNKIYDVDKKPGARGTMVDNVVLENGRIHSSPGFSMIVTDIDYKIITKIYDCKPRILKLWYSRAGRLNKKIVNMILDLYEQKTALKGIEDRADEYAYSKQLINGVYGDMCAAILYDDTILNDDGSWDTVAYTFDQIDERLMEKRAKPWTLKSRFCWGAWITAAARRNHMDFLLCTDCDNDTVYYDTDSVYYLNNHDDDIKAYNERMTARIDAALTELGIDPERSRPKDRNGRPRQMGIIEKEHDNLPEFKCIRAKCYGYRGEDGKLHITVSGVNKKKGAYALNDDLNALADGLVFDYETCGKQISHYNTDQPPCLWIDYNGDAFWSEYKYGLCLQPTQYRLSLDGDFYDILEMLHMVSNHESLYDAERMQAYIRK